MNLISAKKSTKSLGLIIVSDRMCVEFSDMIIATCGHADNQICLSRSLDGAIMQRFEVCPKGVQVTDFCFSSNSKLIMFGCDDTNIGILNMRGTKQVEFTATDHEPNYTCT